MPKYYFHVNDEKGFDDDEGVELENLAAVMREAVRYAGCLLKETVVEIRPDKAWSLEVRDSSGRVVFQIDLQLRANAHFSVVERDSSIARGAERPRLVALA